jgi:hypothetical protein
MGDDCLIIPLTHNDDNKTVTFELSKIISGDKCDLLYSDVTIHFEGKALVI